MGVTDADAVLNGIELDWGMNCVEDGVPDDDGG